MGITTTDRDHIIRTLLTTSGQTTFFTAGEPEVRTWLLRQGGTALEAADGIHTDLARGFIRAEVMTVTDLVRLGSERRDQGPSPHAPGAEGLRCQGRRHSAHSVQRLVGALVPNSGIRV